MICNLCLQGRKLVKAHIIPEFMYKELYDAKHFFHKVKISNSLKVSNLPQGIYDEGIICKDCDDNIINKRGENYASKVLYGGAGLTEEETPKFEKRKNINDEMTTIHISNLDYKKFKLFLLSVLWKSSITQRSEFKEVSLGKHEEIIRNLILNDDPGEIEDYPCFIVNIRNDVKIANELIGVPLKKKYDGCTFYLFLIAGLLYTYYVSKHNVPDFVINCTINKRNELLIPNVPEGHGEYLIRRLFGLYKNS